MKEPYVKLNNVIQMLNNMDRYRTDKLINQEDNKEYPGNEVFIVDDAYEELEQIPTKYIESTCKYYIRFGDLPKEGKSAQHRGDGVIKQEAGISVWDAMIANDVYYPILPKDINESTLQDYIQHLWGNKPVYLVTGDELDEKGSDNEPLLTNVKIIKQLNDTYDYFKGMFKNLK